MKSTKGRLQLLRDRLAARDGVKSYGDNVEALKKEIARLEAELGSGSPE